MCREADDGALGREGSQVDDDDGVPTAFEQLGLNAEGVQDDIERVQAHVFRRRIRIKPFFQVFDPLRTGRIGRIEFCRALAQVFQPNALNDAETPVDAEALAEYFIDPMDAEYYKPRPVNYVRFCETIDKVFTINNLEKNPEVDVEKTCVTVLDAGGFTPRTVRDEAGVFRVLSKIGYLSEQRAVDLGTCFNTRSRAPVDVRVGRIEPIDFMHSFPLAQSTATKEAAISQADMQLLVERYIDDNGFVRLVPFQRDVEAFVAHQNGHDIDLDMLTNGPPTHSGTRGKSLRNSRWFPLAPAPEKLRPQSARTNASNCSSELAAVLNPQRPPSRPQSAMMYRPPRPQSARQVPPPPSAMAKLTKYCFERRLRLYDIFKDADHLRKGVITRTQMCTSLTVLGLSFSQQEYESLFRTFANEAGFFRYPDCAATVEDTLFKARAQAGGNGAKAARAIHNAGSIQTSTVIDAEERAQLANIETLMAKRAHSQRKDIFAVLHNFGLTRWATSGHVTEGQFIRAMKDFEFDVTDKDLNVLLEKYCDTELSNEFNYMDFCKSLDKRLQAMHLMEAHESRFDLSETWDTLKSRSGLPGSGLGGTLWKNPYFDKEGKVRPCSSRPNSAQSRRPLYGSGMVAAGSRIGSRPQSARTR